MCRLSIFVVLIAAGPLFAQVLANKPLPPDAAAAAKARAAALELFGPQIAQAKTLAARKALAQKIHEIANDAKETAVNRWVLYALACDTYALAGEIALAVQTIEEQAGLFTITRMELIAESAEKLAKVATAANSKPLLDLIYAGAEEAIDADDFKTAVRLLNIGLTVARKNTRDEATVRSFELKWKHTGELQKVFDETKGDEERGKLYCFRKGDWARGLPILSRSQNEELASVTKKDLTKPTDAKDQVVLGDAWLELAEKATLEERLGMLRRAFYWYRLGVDGAGGLTKAKVEARMDKIFAEVDAADAKQGLFTLYSGEWTARYANTAVRDYHIDFLGHVVCQSLKLSGALKRQKKEILLNFNDGKLERIRLAGGGIQIDHFTPASEYPTKVSTTGVASPNK